MEYGMYQEIKDQPISLRKTFDAEKEHIEILAKKFSTFDKIYLIGCGSSISSCYSIKDALKEVSSINIDVQTGYEFYHNQFLEPNSNIGVILTSQSGETSDTVAAMRKAKKYNIFNLTITNKKDSTLMKESDDCIFTLCEDELAILGTKTYMTQMLSLYLIFFNMVKSKRAEKILDQLYNIPSVIEKLIATTEENAKKLAYENKDVDIFYCMGSGVNYGLSYKLAMTMFMEGSLKHACPLYSGEFRHGLIERVEKGCTVVFLKSNADCDDIMDKAMTFCENLEINSIIFDLNDYHNIDPLLAPFILIIPLEWFIYHLAIFNNEDPGSTRHIGKIRY